MENSDQQAIGVIKEVHGPVTVIACDYLPPLRQALCTRFDDETYLFEVHQHLDPQHVRAITLHRTAGLQRGMPVYDTGAPLHIITPEFQKSIEFLAHIGIVALLFRVGLKSNIKGLINKLPDASMIWLSNVLVNFSLGFVAARYLLDLSLLTSLVIAVAFTATSVAVSIVVWQERGKLNSTDGQLLIDVTELDDLSGILLLVGLLAIIPLVQANEVVIFSQVGTTIAILVAKLILFISFCYLFAHYLESSFTQFNRQWADPKTGLIISVLGAGLAIAAVAGYLGFSLAIGGLFAGLAFSRDPQAVHTDNRFMMLYEFFTPFFFIYIGMQVDPTTLTKSISLAAVLVIIASIGKIAGVSLPALRNLPKRSITTRYKYGTTR